jgi:hypothetical protein
MRERQEDLWYGGELPIAPGHPLIVQDPPAATLTPQVFVWERVVEPVMVMLLMLSAVLHHFVILIDIVSES